MGNVRLDRLRMLPESAQIDVNNPSVGRVLWAVAGVALLVNSLSLSASHLWVCPDTGYYVALAGGIADRGDFSSELSLMRPPGYPLMLALIFRLFGPWSPTAIQVAQHGMVAATAVLIAATAWHLTRHRQAAFTAGVMCALSLQLIAYGNLIITEAPFTLVVTLSVYFLVRYHRDGNGPFLLLASLMAGISYLFRPIGITTVAMCALAALHLTWRRPNHAECHDASPTPLAPGGHRANGGVSPRPWRRAVFGLALAVVPAFAITLPGMIYNKATHGGDLSSRCANLALYFRAFYFDRLDSPRSEALSEIRAVVDQAVKRGHLAPGADYRAWGQVWKAYEAVRGEPLVESSAVMGRAARDAILDNLGTTLVKTARYSAWMLLSPDMFYRFQPGGAPGVSSPGGDFGRDQQAEIFDIATYQPTVRRWTEPYAHYLPLRTDPTPTTPLWSGISLWFHRSIEKGPSILGAGDTPYEAFIWLCLVCIAGSLLTRNRTTWLLVAGVIALQIVASAFLAGPTARYAVPVRPLLLLYPSLLVLLPGYLAGFVRHRRAKARAAFVARPTGPESSVGATAIKEHVT